MSCEQMLDTYLSELRLGQAAAVVFGLTLRPVDCLLTIRLEPAGSQARYILRLVHQGRELESGLYFELDEEQALAAAVHWTLLQAAPALYTNGGFFCLEPLPESQAQHVA